MIRPGPAKLLPLTPGRLRFLQALERDLVGHRERGPVGYHLMHAGLTTWAVEVDGRWLTNEEFILMRSAVSEAESLAMLKRADHFAETLTLEGRRQLMGKALRNGNRT